MSHLVYEYLSLERVIIRVLVVDSAQVGIIGEVGVLP